MTKHNPIATGPISGGKPGAAPSLLERAAEVYDFAPVLEQRGDALKKSAEQAEPLAPPPAPVRAPVAAEPVRPADPVPSVAAARPVVQPRPPILPVAHIDRDLLARSAFIVPDGPVSSVSEEFRIVKRRLLLAAGSADSDERVPFGERILVCSAYPNEGKTFCAINLALSIAAEQDNEVLLVDADFAKPSILSSLGIEGKTGLMDALANPAIQVEDCIIPTDIRGLSVLPAGQQTNNDTEYLASARTREVLASLTRNNPSRIVIFDSPPALAASPASELAMHVGQALLVVKADKTSETALKDALGLLSGCENIQLLLNGVKFSPTGRSFGSYYGYGA